jgi:hypothetical protein
MHCKDCAEGTNNEDQHRVRNIDGDSKESQRRSGPRGLL